MPLGKLASLSWGGGVLSFFKNVSMSKYLTSLSICFTLAHTEVFCTVKLRISHLSRKSLRVRGTGQDVVFTCCHVPLHLILPVFAEIVNESFLTSTYIISFHLIAGKCLYAQPDLKLGATIIHPFLKCQSFASSSLFTIADLLHYCLVTFMLLCLGLYSPISDISFWYLLQTILVK